MKSIESMALGVVVERREIDNRWEDHEWRPVAVIPGAPEVEEWRPLRSGPGWTQYHIDTLPLELFRKETEGYRLNLSTERPLVYIILRRGEEADEREIEASLVTACPYEAQDYLDSGDDLVEGVAMPEPVAALVADFIDQHHVEEPFRKRRNRRWQDDGGGGRRRSRGNGGG